MRDPISMVFSEIPNWKLQPRIGVYSTWKMYRTRRGRHANSSRRKTHRKFWELVGWDLAIQLFIDIGALSEISTDWVNRFVINFPNIFARSE